MFQPAFALTINNARVALDAGLAALEAGQTRFDLGRVTAVDSAALATLFAWRRAATEQGVELSFSNFPPNLASLAEVYGVSALLQG